jgi:hypothetical protein
MTLQDRLDAFKADFEAGKPPYNVPSPVIATMHRATAELIASGQAERAKKAGQPIGDPITRCRFYVRTPTRSRHRCRRDDDFVRCRMEILGG